MPEVTEAMIADDSFPVRWTDVNETVSLEVDSQRWVAARIQSLDVELPMQYMHPWLGRLCRDNTLVADVVEYRYHLREHAATDHRRPRPRPGPDMTRTGSD